MPFSLDQAQGYNPDEILEQSYAPDHPFACQYIIGVRNNAIKRVQYNLLAPATHSHYMISGDRGSIRLDTTSAWINTNGQLLITNPGDVKFQDVAAVKTHPGGAGISVWADSFVEYSMRRFKENITPLPEALMDANLPPRKYKQNNKSRLGFIAEELPSEVLFSTQDDDDTTIQGIDILALCALQQGKIDDLTAKINDLTARIEQMEKRR